MKSPIFKTIFLLSFIFVFTSCSSIKERKIEKQKQKELAIQNIKKSSALDEYVSKLSIQEKVCQLFIENLEGNSKLIPVEHYGDLSGNRGEGKALIPGGYIFFSYNLSETPQKVISFTNNIKKYCFDNELIVPFLAADQEGGLVTRLRNLCGPLPSNQRVSEKLDLTKAYELYELQALQMKALGFDMNLAPVVEVCTDYNKEFLNERSFGSKEQVISYGKACVTAYENNGICTVLKHFPGNSNTDPHTGLPEIDLSLEKMNDLLEPFCSLMKMSSAVLMSHARTVCLDSQVPACLSYSWITDRIRNTEKYEGIIFSDDIFMGALQDNGYPPEKACVMAIDSGINCIMISEKRFGKAAKVLIEKASEDETFSQKIDESVKKILSYKIKAGYLEYQKKETETDYEYELVPVLNFDSLENRLESFNQAKKKNVELYMEYFYNK